MLRVVLVDDTANLRLLTRLNLELDGLAEIVGEACDGHEALGLIETLRPDVAVIDLHMPRMGGVELITRLRHKGDPIRLVAYSSDEFACCDALLAGADEAILKTGDVNGIVGALNRRPA